MNPYNTTVSVRMYVKSWQVSHKSSCRCRASLLSRIVGIAPGRIRCLRAGPGLPDIPPAHAKGREEGKGSDTCDQVEGVVDRIGVGHQDGAEVLL